ncbi:MAG: hypothetical protein LH654_02910 [Thermoleophilia bacterium]|nr:hypothetical protein [Thermoleophilia bacterium]
MTNLKIVLAGVAVVVLMVVAQDQRWPQKLGVVGACGATAAPSSAPGGYWYACKEGILNGFPSLGADHCSNLGIVQHREIWQCDMPLASVPGA